jgi:succinate dehydrogenase cytochrome b556 subunit
MAVSTERAANAGGIGVSIPGADRLVWYFLRVSGVLLVILAGGHMFITHYLNLPSETTFDFVAARWSNPLWRTFDWLLLISALWHGIYGLRYSVTDYLRRPGWRVLGHSTIYVLGFIFTALGTITIFTFNEEAARENLGPLAGQTWIAEAITWSLYAFALLTYVAIPLLLFWILRSYRTSGPPIYAGDPGQYAWVFHRATGIGIVFFLLVHIIDIALIGLGRDLYDRSVEAYGNPLLIPMEVALVGAVVYHTLNGLRIISVDFSRLGYKRERQSFYAVLLLSVLLTLPSAILLILHEL